MEKLYSYTSFPYLPGKVQMIELCFFCPVFLPSYLEH